MAQADRLRVIVVGAGPAGLAAATALTDSGCDVLCLEARDRVGGRLLSAPGNDGGSDRGGALDLGATWFWDGERRTQTLNSRLAIATFAQHTAGSALIQDGSGVHRLPGNPIDVAAYRYATGADTLAIRLAAGLPENALRLGAPATAIRLAADGIEVTALDTRHRADHVILAVPPALAIRRIDFDAGLSTDLTRLAAATPVWMGAVVKVVAVYTRTFWRANGLAGAAISNSGPLQELHDMSGPDGRPPALFGFAPAAAVQTGFERAVRDQLAALFGPEAAHPHRLHVQDWSREEWTSPPETPHLTEYGLFGHALYRSPALNGRLHWASTETAAEHPGHLEGALEAGRRAADAVLTDVASSPPSPEPHRSSVDRRRRSRDDVAPG